MGTKRTLTKGRSTRGPAWLGSSGRVALVGVLASVTTLGFMLWIQYIIRYQVDVGEPMVRSAMELEAMLDRSFVELRGWVAYGEPESKVERARIWREGIIPRLETLLEISAELQGTEVTEQVDALAVKLRRLRYLQWTLEDIARSPGNHPARARYEIELRPLEASADEQLEVTVAIGAKSDVAQTALSLRNALVETDRAMGVLLDAYTPANEATTRKWIEQSRQRVAAVHAQWGEMAEMGFGPARALLLSAKELSAYMDAAAKVVDTRRSKIQPMTEVMYQTQLRPLEQEVRRIAYDISEQQKNEAIERGQGIFKWSFAVLALALLMGVLSASTLYLSYRLEYRMQRALAKAQSLGQYVIEEKIGAGGMGEVYRAKHALLRRPSAVKVLRIESLFDPSAQERFQNEVQMTSQLSHPHTIAIFDYGRTGEGMFYYAMELLDGASLDILVQLVGPLPPGRIIRILQQMCGSLHEAHEKGLLHRDVKPSNVMVAQVGGVFDHVKVLDFGLVARVTDPVAQGSQRIVGTPAYLAPEAIQAEENASPKSDIYGVGAVGYFLLTGTSVFEHDTVTDVLRAHLEEAPEPPSSRVGGQISKDLEDIVLGCLAKNPGDRPKSAAVLRRMLGAVAVEPWTDEDAEIWWDEYGEAIEAEVQAQQRNSGLTRTHIGARSALDLSAVRRS